MLHYRSIVPPLAALLAVALFARLGIWQLHRADEARALDGTIAARGSAAPVRLDAAALAGNLSEVNWRPVEVHGNWDDAKQILLDNQVSNGVAGYYVYTPLHLPACHCAVLVNRGWIPGGPRRDVAPDVGSATPRPVVRGVAAPAPASGFGLDSGPGERLGATLLRVQKLDPVQLSDWLGERIVPLTVLLAPDEPDGYRRDWRPPAARADRHVAYAVQWFLFAAIAAFLAVRMNSRRR